MTWNGQVSFVEFDAHSAGETATSLQLEANSADAHAQPERARFLRAVAEGIERKPRAVPRIPQRPTLAVVHSTPEAARTRWTRLKQRVRRLGAVAPKNHQPTEAHGREPSLRLVWSERSSLPRAESRS
jgi:hypothetical protein